MSLDFTFTKYGELCKTILKSDYSILTVKKYLSLSRKLPNRFIILRHDVDLKPERSVAVAKLESEFGIKSTYYFRITREVYRPQLIKEIADLGHEIGYHYEVVDKAKGDYTRAIKIFEHELNLLRGICKIETICMHGRSWTPWNNRLIWNYYDFKKFGIRGEVYLSINYIDIAYFSDTARTWSNKYKIKDLVSTTTTLKTQIKTTDELIAIIKNNVFDKIMILMHPDVWSSNLIQWFRDLTIQSIKNLGKNFLILWHSSER